MVQKVQQTWGTALLELFPELLAESPRAIANKARMFWRHRSGISDASLLDQGLLLTPCDAPIPLSSDVIDTSPKNVSVPVIIALAMTLGASNFVDGQLSSEENVKECSFPPLKRTVRWAHFRNSQKRWKNALGSPR